MGFVAIARTMFMQYPRRTILGLSLFIGQAFLYNGITFGYAQILAKFFHVTTNPGYYFAVIGVGNLLGPLLLGRLFDTLGRKPMIAVTYLVSGLLRSAPPPVRPGRADRHHDDRLLVRRAVLRVGRRQRRLPHRERGLPDGDPRPGIAFFYAIGTAAGGIAGPLLFSSLVSTGKVPDTVLAFSIGAVLMILAGLVEIFLGVKAERQSLEDIAQPLTAADTGTVGQSARHAHAAS